MVIMNPEFLEELFAIMGVMSIVANTLIFFVIVKYDKLRLQATNIIIANLSILQILSMLGMILFNATLFFLRELYYDTPVHKSLFCNIREFLILIMLNINLIEIFLICDWYVKLYHEDKYVKFCRIYKFLLTGVYVSNIVMFVIQIQGCVRAEEHQTWVNMAAVDFAVYVCLVAFLVIMDVTHKFKKRLLRANKNNSVGLVVVNIYVFFWFPATIQIFLSCYDSTHELTLILSIVLGMSNPIFVLLYLRYWDKNFRIFFKKAFTCQCRNAKSDLLVVYSDEGVVHVDC